MNNKNIHSLHCRCCDKIIRHDIDGEDFCLDCLSEVYKNIDIETEEKESEDKLIYGDFD